MKLQIDGLDQSNYVGYMNRDILRVDKHIFVEYLIYLSKRFNNDDDQLVKTYRSLVVNLNTVIDASLAMHLDRDKYMKVLMDEAAAGNEEAKLQLAKHDKGAFNNLYELAKSADDRIRDLAVRELHNSLTADEFTKFLIKLDDPYYVEFYLDDLIDEIYNYIIENKLRECFTAPIISHIQQQYTKLQTLKYAPYGEEYKKLEEKFKTQSKK